MRMIAILLFTAACQSNPSPAYGDGYVRSFDPTLANCEVVASYDYGGGSPFDVTSQYDGAGRMTSFEDSDRHRFTSTFSKNLLVQTDGETTGNDTFSHVSTYRYDEENRLIRYTIDEEWFDYDVGSGVIGTDRFRYDGDQLVRQLSDWDGDGDVDYELEYTWADDGLSSTETSDQNDDVVDYTYDEALNLIEVITTPAGEGQLTKFATYEYDEQEPHWPTRRDGGYRGTDSNWTLTFTYSCP